AIRMEDDSSSLGVRQGFLCPFCLDDLGDFNALQAHVEVKHPEGGTVEDSIDQIKKGILSQARKLKSTASTLLDSIPSTSSNGGVSDGHRPLSSTNQSIATTVTSDKRSPQGERRGALLAPRPMGRLGVRRSLIDSFRDDRDAYVHDSAVRTNMLIIRLDRLINECPADPSSRKAFERTIVPWTADSSVSLCAACAAKFSLTRRRHHCRLCGAVMCSSCSRFLSFLSARKLTNPALAAQMLAALSSANQKESAPLASLEPAPILAGQTGAKAAAEAMVGLAKKSSGQLMSLLKSAKETIDRTGEDSEEGSVRSLQSQDAAEHMRVCPSCIGFLTRRETQMEGCTAPSFVSLYDQLRILLTEVTNLSPSYARTAESLRNGETLYTLPDAENLRRKLVMKQKEIDNLSKRIADDFDENTVGREDAKLRKRIRGAALMELQQTVVALPPLPSEDEYGKLKERRKAEVARQIAESRSRMEEAQRDARSKPLSASPSLPSMVGVQSGGVRREEKRRTEREKEKEGLARSNSMLDGWTPEQRVSTNPFIDEEEQDHPLIVQRMQVKSFLQQAADAGKVDDARILEENLRMIDEEIIKLGIDTPRD
ncbi:hypothetical protein PFISCL1PPCAC_16446, partial [Pristionchus fissidentatus]